MKIMGPKNIFILITTSYEVISILLTFVLAANMLYLCYHLIMSDKSSKNMGKDEQNHIWMTFLFSKELDNK